ncbi:hypothetical protein E1B28_003526 [Marasmius oreades]|uniref:Uncharacterized protein n=1 Tax=Marasmius oreades TaxID=181124 RepID=A0A9P7RMR0_9AGAR|nr:uncharacterized protein E1B28_003526 [Marasmius oreades]KAG7086003.1 hypothetical protein E1B28_003526 [Marasmius oreades]
MSATVFLLIANIVQFLANLGDIVYPPLGILVTFWTLRRTCSEDNATINSTALQTVSEFSPTSIDSSIVPTPEEPPENWVKACRTALKQILENLNDILQKGLLDGGDTKERFMQLIDMQERQVSRMPLRLVDGIAPDIRRNTVHVLIELEQDVDDFVNTIERSRLKREARCDELSDAESGFLSPLWARPSSKNKAHRHEPESETPSELPAVAEHGSMAPVWSHDMHSGTSNVETGSSICDQHSPQGASTKLDDTEDHDEVQQSVAWRGRFLFYDGTSEMDVVS